MPPDLPDGILETWNWQFSNLSRQPLIIVASVTSTRFESSLTESRLSGPILFSVARALCADLFRQVLGDRNGSGFCKEGYDALEPTKKPCRSGFAALPDSDFPAGYCRGTTEK